MDTKDVEYLYNFYKNSIGQIRKIEKSLIKESYSYQKWSELLHSKSSIIRSIYEENVKLIEQMDEEFTPEIADIYISNIDFFIAEEYRDYKMDAYMLKKLYAFYKSENDRKRIFDTSYYLGIALVEQRKFKESIKFFEESISLYENLNECEEIYRRFRIVCSYYYLLIAMSFDKSTSQSELIKCAKKCKVMWIDEDIIDFVSPKKELGLSMIVNNLVCHYTEQLLFDGKQIEDELFYYIESLYKEQLKRRNNEMIMENELFVIYHRVMLERGLISYEDYKSAIKKKYTIFNIMNSTNFEYGTSSFIYLYDDETLDEDFAVETLFYMNPSINFIYYLVPEILKTDIIKREEIIDEIIKYYKCFPIVPVDYKVDLIIEKNIKRIVKFFSVDKFLELMEAIFLTRQATTQIHNCMVSKIAKRITESLIESNPELFVNTLCAHNEKEVLTNKQIYLDFVDKAARLHDIGKIRCSDIINLQIRKIEDEEFEIIKEHPEVGAEILGLSEELKPFRDIALMHHKTYDEKGGYPNEIWEKELKYGIFVDIIKISDSIDAATDALGRNYAKGKDFYTVLLELKEMKGTVYSDVVVNAIDNDDELKESLQRITGVDREMTYYDIYRNHLEPTVNFRPRDEKFVRAFRESDIDEIVSFRSIEKSHIEELYNKYCDCSFIICDGYGKIYGYAFASIEGEIVKVQKIYIRKDARRQGYGSMLLNSVEKNASNVGCKKIQMQVDYTGHNDKFCWRCNFNRAVGENIVEKDIVI